MINCHECGEPMDDPEEGGSTSCDDCHQGHENYIEAMKWNDAQLREYDRTHPRQNYD